MEENVTCDCEDDAGEIYEDCYTGTEPEFNSDKDEGDPFVDCLEEPIVIVQDLENESNVLEVSETSLQEKGSDFDEQYSNEENIERIVDEYLCQPSEDFNDSDMTEVLHPSECQHKVQVLDYCINQMMDAANKLKHEIREMQCAINKLNKTFDGFNHTFTKSQNNDATTIYTSRFQSETTHAGRHQGRFKTAGRCQTEATFDETCFIPDSSIEDDCGQVLHEDRTEIVPFKSETSINRQSCIGTHQQLQSKQRQPFVRDTNKSISIYYQISAEEELKSKLKNGLYFVRIFVLIKRVSNLFMVTLCYFVAIFGDDEQLLWFIILGGQVQVIVGKALVLSVIVAVECQENVVCFEYLPDVSRFASQTELACDGNQTNAVDENQTSVDDEDVGDKSQTDVDKDQNNLGEEGLTYFDDKDQTGFVGEGQTGAGGEDQDHSEGFERRIAIPLPRDNPLSAFPDVITSDRDLYYSDSESQAENPAFDCHAEVVVCFGNHQVDSVSFECQEDVVCRSEVEVVSQVQIANIECKVIYTENGEAEWASHGCQVEVICVDCPDAFGKTFAESQKNIGLNVITDAELKNKCVVVHGHTYIFNVGCQVELARNLFPADNFSEERQSDTVYETRGSKKFNGKEIISIILVLFIHSDPSGKGTNRKQTTLIPTRHIVCIVCGLSDMIVDNLNLRYQAALAEDVTISLTPPNIQVKANIPESSKRQVTTYTHLSNPLESNLTEVYQLPVKDQESLDTSKGITERESRNSALSRTITRGPRVQCTSNIQCRRHYEMDSTKATQTYNCNLTAVKYESSAILKVHTLISKSIRVYAGCFFVDQGVFIRFMVIQQCYRGKSKEMSTTLFFASYALVGFSHISQTENKVPQTNSGNTSDRSVELKENTLNDLIRSEQSRHDSESCVTMYMYRTSRKNRIIQGDMFGDERISCATSEMQFCADFKRGRHEHKVNLPSNGKWVIGTTSAKPPEVKSCDPSITTHELYEGNSRYLHSARTWCRSIPPPYEHTTALLRTVEFESKNKDHIGTAYDGGQHGNRTQVPTFGKASGLDKKCLCPYGPNTQRNNPLTKLATSKRPIDDDPKHFEKRPISKTKKTKDEIRLLNILKASDHRDEDKLCDYAMKSSRCSEVETVQVQKIEKLQSNTHGIRIQKSCWVLKNKSSSDTNLGFCIIFFLFLFMQGNCIHGSPIDIRLPMAADILWEQTTIPAVFGESMTLTCYVPNESNSLYWHREPSDLLSKQNYTVDPNKYQITITYTENTTIYCLTILHLEMSDLGRWYRCSDSLDNRYEQYLNLSENNFVYKPTNEDIIKRSWIDGKVMKAEITVRQIYPTPKCTLEEEKILLATNMTFFNDGSGLYNIKQVFDIKTCDTNTTISCTLNGYRVIQETFVQDDSLECLTAIEGEENGEKLFVYYIGLGLIVTSVIIGTLIMIVKRRGVPCNRSSYDISNEELGKTENVTFLLKVLECDEH